MINSRQMTSTFALLATCSSVTASDFIDDSSASLTARNYYIDRDFKGDSRFSAAREWAQGFIFKGESGFTEGTIGIGVNVTGSVGLQLDSSPDRTGTQLLPFNPLTRETSREYSELGGSIKFKASETILQAGDIYPTLPVVYASPARLIQQYYRGYYLTSKDVADFTLHVGHFDKVNQRDSTDYQKIYLANPNSRYRAGATSDQFNFIGADYNWSDALIFKAYHSELQDIFTQDHLGATYTFQAGPGTLKTDLRYFGSRESGKATAGQVDNRNYGAMFTYQILAHSFGLGYMHQSGESGLPYLGGGEGGVLTEGALSSDFVNPQERVLVARYDYNFAALGLPGLKGMLRYMYGDNIKLNSAGPTDLSESAKDAELSYVIQSGPARGLAFRLRHAIYRNDFPSSATFQDANETRVNIDYTWKFK